MRSSSARGTREESRWRSFRPSTASGTRRSGKSPESFHWSGPLALWITGESGESGPVLERAEGVTLEMEGEVESLNVTVAASLLLDAARRGVAR